MKTKYFPVTLCTLLCLTCINLKAVEEKDWMNNWHTPELPGTEVLPFIDIDELDGYSISVSYALDGGRFGDQLINYLKALWVSWKYNVPLIYRPFDYADQMVLSDFHDIILNEEVINSFSAKLPFLSLPKIEQVKQVFAYLDKQPIHDNGKKGQLIWNIGMLTPLVEERFGDKLDDEAFRSFIQQLVKPKNELSLVSLSKDYKTIAIHVRTGVGYDWEINIRNMPTKFPADTFYLSSLRQAICHFEGEPLYIHIFTDHPEPAIIEKKFLDAFKSWGFTNDVVFNCRRSGNSHTQNVLEDLFSMTQFDCLIHPDSSISRLVAILSAPALEFKPPNWAIYRKDSNGNPILDKEGKFIVDPLVVKRAATGKPVYHTSLEPIEPWMLFD